MTELEKKVNQINEEYFLPLFSEEMWKEDYNSNEFQQAQNFLKSYLQYFEVQNHTLITQVLKSHIKYFKWVSDKQKNINEKSLKKVLPDAFNTKK